MQEIILVTIRLAMLILTISTIIAVVVTVTRYITAMLTALPALIPVALFITIPGCLFFVIGFTK